MAKEKNERAVSLEKITPLDSAILSDIDYERAVAYKAVEGISDNVRILAESGLKLDMHDSRQLGVAMEVRNIQYNGTSIRQYLGIVQLLLEEMDRDMKTIYYKRKEFMRVLLLNRARQEAAQKEEERRAKEAERIAEKRAAETEADDLNN